MFISVGKFFSTIQLAGQWWPAAENKRFSDIWAEEWKSQLQIAIQLLFRLKDHRWTFYFGIICISLFGCGSGLNVFQISIHQKALTVVCKFFFATKQILNDIYNSTSGSIWAEVPWCFFCSKKAKKNLQHNKRFSDIWADEWKSRLHIAIQLQSRLTNHRWTFEYGIICISLFSDSPGLNVFQISIQQQAVNVGGNPSYSATEIDFHS